MAKSTIPAPHTTVEAIREAQAVEQKGREGWMRIMCDVAKAAGWSEAQLTDNGSGEVYICEVLTELKGAYSSGELSKWRNVCHPRVRDQLDAINEKADAIGRKFGIRRDNVMVKMCSKLKASDASTVETAATDAIIDYQKAADKKAQAPDPNSVDGIMAAMLRRLDGKVAKSLFTPESLSAAITAVKGLEAKPVATQDVEASPAPAAEPDVEVGDALNNFESRLEQMLEAKLAAMMAKM